MVNYENVMSLIQERYNNDIYSYEEANELMFATYENYITEGFFKTPLKDKLKKLEEIKNTNPRDYTGNKNAKIFVDKHYGEIKQVVDILEKENKSVSKAGLKTVITILGGTLIGSVLLPLGEILPLLISVIAGAFIYINNMGRSIHNSWTAQDLSEIKTMLNNMKTKKIPVQYKNKINTLIKNIAQTSFHCRV